METMEFPPLYIQWIRQCVTTPRFSIFINKGLEGYFEGKRGLRQGNPISPYLFLMVMKGLFAILQQKISHGSFTYHPKCSVLKLRHLAFADDLFVLCGADSQSMSVVKEGLDDFYYFSG